jgi:phenylacetate-CoA ligase
MLRLPDGRGHWPSFPYEDLKPIADFRQIQIVQHQIDELEVHLAGVPPMTPETEVLFSDKLRRLLHGQFFIRYAYPATIPSSAGGKFEDFVSLIPDSN